VGSRSPARILITGVTGFVGCHLARALLAQPDTRVHGVSLHSAWPAAGTDLVEPVPLVSSDLCDTQHLVDLLRHSQPTHIYHLAGYADVSRSFSEPEAAWTGNLTATQSLYHAVLEWGGRPRMLYVSTGAVYGEPEDPSQLIDERAVLRPNSPYASSKAAADVLSYEQTRSRGLDIIRVRPFNHVGPGQSPRYALANFAWQIAAIEQGRQPPVLRVGNLWTQRDLADVRDVVEAYRLLMDSARAGDVFNIASGVTLPMQTFLDRLLALSSARIRVETDPELLRKVETAAVRVDTSALRRLTGWTPRFTLEQTMTDMLEWCREQSTTNPDR
jgi:GDP-4-dehydro-6-deoxy-D-mannose reductase